MKNFSKLLIALVTIVTLSSASLLMDELPLGAKYPKGDLKLIDVNDKEYSLNSIKTEKGMLVFFSCNTCPYVKLSESRIKEYSDLAQKSGIGTVIVNSNEAQRDGDDSKEEMKKYASAQKFTCPYVIDAKSELADAFGATRTPQIFLFDKDGKLVYKGAIDDNVKDPKAVKSFFLRDAINAVAKGTAPAVSETKSIGCTIKRVEN